MIQLSRSMIRRLSEWDNIRGIDRQEEYKMVKTTVGVDGMMCGMCESHVNEAVRRAFEGSIKKVTSSHLKKKTEIISENALDEEKLKAVINATGYTAVSVAQEPYEKKGFSLFGKRK